MQDQILTLQEMPETAVDDRGQGAEGVTHLTSFISVFSDCSSSVITIY